MYGLLWKPANNFSQPFHSLKKRGSYWRYVPLFEVKNLQKIPSANSLLKRAFDCCQLFRSRLSTTMTYFANYQTPNFVRNHNCLGLFLYTWICFTKPPKVVSDLFCLYSASLALNQDFYKDEAPPMNHLCFHFYFTQWTVSSLLHPVWLPAAHWHTGFLKAWGWQHTFPELFSFLLNHS